MNYKLKIITSLSFFAYAYLAIAAAPAAAPAAGQVNVHDTYQRLLELKKKSNDLDKQVLEDDLKIEGLIEKNKDNPKLMKAIQKADWTFAEIEDKAAQLRDLKYSGRSDPAALKKIDDLTRLINNFYNIIATDVLGYPRNIASIIDAKIKLQKIMIESADHIKEYEHIKKSYESKGQARENSYTEGEGDASQINSQQEALNSEISQ